MIMEDLTLKLVRVQNSKKPNHIHSTSLTKHLDTWHKSDQKTLEILIDVSYQQLNVISRNLLKREQNKVTLQTQALVHEAYLRIRELKTLEWQSKQHFFSVWSGIMRRVLIDYARNRHALKRGGLEQPITMQEYHLDAQKSSTFTDLYDAIDNLKNVDEIKSTIVELRYIAGLSIEEIATLLSISPATVKRKWALAKAWLFVELEGSRCLTE